jgi:hypothetical protein
VFGHEDGCRYVGMGAVVRPAQDPARDARVAARREAARRRASADLDRFIADLYGSLNDRCECRQFGWSDRCPLHH